ncbi:MAG: metallophosphoesterase [Myxococcales bacterium]|nr:metallophosphoesterase [Myxococcales bacterium]
MRVLHFSDVHVDVPIWRWPVGEMWNKRLVGAANLILRRRRHFKDARAKLAQLAEFAERERVDLAICTGDYTALGTVPELEAARAAIAGLTRRPRGFVTVPGNHDLYLPDTVADGRFDRIFGDLLGTDWPERAVDGIYPAVRLYDDHFAVVAVNSARPNPPIMRSSGRIPEAQLAALAELLAAPELAARTVFVITHYAPRRRDGTPDRFDHGLENAEELLAACAAAPARTALLHGHIHWRYHLKLPDIVPHLFGAGSTTCGGREGLWLFDVSPEGVRATPGGYHDGDYRLEGATPVSF